MSFIINPYRYAAGASFYQYATADGADADISDAGGLHSAGTFTVPAAWNGRYVRVGAGGRTSSNSTSLKVTMNKGGAQFDGAAEYFGSGVTNNPGGATGHSAPTVVTTGDAFTMSGPVNNTNGSWKYMEVLSSSFSGAMANRTSTFSVGTAYTTCEWNNEVYDTDGYFTTGSPTVFTIPSGRSGKFRIQAGLECTAPGTEMGLTLSTSADPGNMECDNSAGGALSIFSPPLSLTTSDTASLSVRTQSATTMKVDANTWYSIEELPSGIQYAIAEFGSSVAVASGSTFQSVSPSTEFADVGGWYTAGQDHFTVPSGVTKIRLGFFIKSTNTLGSAWGFGIFKNGAEFQQMPYNAQTNASVECLHGASGIIEVTAGDTFDFRARTAAGSMSVAAGSFIWIEEVQAVTS